MKAFILIPLLFSFLSFADNAPYYQQEDIDDVKFAISEIPNKATYKCTITVSQEKLKDGISSSALFDCDFSLLEKSRRVTWNGVSSKDFTTLIKKSLVKDSHTIIKTTNIDTETYQLLFANKI